MARSYNRGTTIGPTIDTAPAAATTAGVVHFEDVEGNDIECSPVWFTNRSTDPILVKLNAGTASALVYDILVPDGATYDVSGGRVAVSSLSFWIVDAANDDQGTHWQIQGINPGKT